MNLRGIGFLDLSAFTATFVRTYRERMKDDANYEGGGAQTLLLRSATTDASFLKEWKTARAVLNKLRNEAAPFLGGKPATLGKAMIVSLKPGSFTQWQWSDDEYSQAHFRLHVCMIPSPMAYVFAGGEAGNLIVGNVTYVNTQSLHSEINLGPCARVHLVVDVRKPEEE